MSKRLFSRDKLSRNAAVLVLYGGLLTFSFYMSYALRFLELEFPEQWHIGRRHQVIWIVPVELLFLYAFGQFRGFLSYFRLPDLFRLWMGLVSFAGLLFIIYIASNVFYGKNWAPPMGVIVINLMISAIGLSFFRVGLRLYRESRPAGPIQRVSGVQRRVAIVGAGEVGSMVAADLLAKRGLGLKPMVFLDDNEGKHGHEIHGIPVVGSPNQLALTREAYDIEQIIIALPANAQRRVREVVTLAKTLGLETEIVPSMWDLASGRVQASQIRPVELEDLLGRDPVSLDSDKIQEMLRDRVVMVTGAGGSIGGELCRQIAKCLPKRLLLVDHSEVQLFQIEQELIGLGHSNFVQPFVTTVLDVERMDWLMQTQKPALVFHAAAHKHVPMMEHQPFEALKNNAVGTYQLAQLASRHKVDMFVLVSTDKAINPTSVMGCTKRIAEMTVQALQQVPGNVTRFCAVRFGNVLGSSGSVIPTFKRQIAEGGPVTVTHPDVMRYFMTIPESVGLILQAASQAVGGEIFVLDMGQPIKIVDVARQLIELSGFRPEIDIEIKFIGLRPGEKLFEELRHQGEQFQDTVHKRIYRFVCSPATPAQAEEWMRQLTARLTPDHRAELKQFLITIVPEYTPYLE